MKTIGVGTLELVLDLSSISVSYENDKEKNLPKNLCYIIALSYWGIVSSILTFDHVVYAYVVFN